MIIHEEYAHFTYILLYYVWTTKLLKTIYIVPYKLTIDSIFQINNLERLTLNGNQHYFTRNFKYDDLNSQVDHHSSIMTLATYSRYDESQRHHRLFRLHPCYDEIVREHPPYSDAIVKRFTICG